MHHYRCQNVYISATASERIVETLEFFPHNFQIPQLSSTDRLIVAANDMSNAFKKPHPEVPFSHIGDQRTFPAKSSNPILASHMPPQRQTRSQTTIHAQDITNTPLLPRVVTPMTSRPAPLRVPMR
jgi:hypothetical protein